LKLFRGLPCSRYFNCFIRGKCVEKAVFIDDILENAQGAVQAGLNAIHLPACAEIEPYFIFKE